ncbi:hypothetical protein M3641_26215 [Bacillus cereus]|uniref:DUF6602 domain-containing protein n=1 Tax=Bacillus cereus TaxID=1396 RepID=UPI00203D347C|nr:DUF6602 domain-containing protein [Bacillus cereus]MCM3330159.1 hypothetical protein [Bacillus cereus]MEB9970085.1 hypothetical protein [Bacillus cereus]
MHEINTKELFYGLQKQMQQKLLLNREFIKHPGTKGDSLELNWISLLRDYLPQRYSIDSAFIIDCHNNLSDQIDIVIYDRQYSPFVFNQDDVKYIPAESVYAVFEVKQDISKEYIKYAGKKAESVRTLTRTSAPIYHAGGCYPPKPLNNILAGILTLSSTWAPALGESFKNNILELEENQVLNLGCILDGGSFKYIDKEMNISTEEESLIFFFLNLLIELQKLGTIPAMDITRYASALDSI